ncbi:hypothetical protein DEAC_c23600 [Desulfosporosinus acididurans]|uniref:Phage-like element PBSX protein XkdM n=1 Tax=Desulfosporosinus acididurans TaxID=476652 RepID=A0A0J1FQE8_9FIRM|nr:DUF6711 family protein [Desulfosporosinus acididurans]KLU65730.1 hypothetical protein DEAC_c23600 [Desulfosporosinus acididurans]
MANTLTVNGTALPEPQKITNNLYMIGDSKRNAAGTMNLQYIANKRKYNIQWGTMSASQLTTVISQLKSSTPQFSLTVLDPGLAGGSYTGTFYAGDLAYDDVKIDSFGNVVFNNIKIDLIEC